jgi:hypothetical protein
MSRNPGIKAVRIVKGDRVLHVHGALGGSEGVWMAMGQVHGLYDAPVKTTYKAGAFQEGSTHRRTQKLQRDLEIGFHVRDTNTTYELNDSVLAADVRLRSGPLGRHPVTHHHRGGNGFVGHPEAGCVDV